MTKQQSDRLITILERFENMFSVPDMETVVAPEIESYVVVPDDIEEVLEEMATEGLITRAQMNRLIDAIRPILEENRKLKNK